MPGHIVDAEDGGKKAITALAKQRVAVIKMYTLLGHYVETACNDDLATFTTSGFTQAAVKTRTAPAPLTEAKFSSIDRGPNSGDANMSGCECKRARSVSAIARNIKRSAQREINGTEIALKTGVLYPKV